jgi:hypothetical protein
MKIMSVLAIDGNFLCETRFAILGAAGGNPKYTKDFSMFPSIVRLFGVALKTKSMASNSAPSRRTLRPAFDTLEDRAVPTIYMRSSPVPPPVMAKALSVSDVVTKPSDTTSAALSKESVAPVATTTPKLNTEPSTLGRGPTVVRQAPEVVRVTDDKGNVLGQVYTLDVDGDGRNDFVDIVTREFDENGRVTKEVFTTDGDADGRVDGRITKTMQYDDAGHVIEESRTDDYNGDGKPDFIGSTSRTFDDEGRQTSNAVRVDTDGDGTLEYERIDTNSFDANGNPTGHSTSYDYNGDGQPDFVGRTERAYDDQGRLIRERIGVDENGDGREDFIKAGTWTYDAKGDLVEQSGGFDEDGDGDVEFAAVKREYDNAHRVIKEVVCRDVNNDGVYDHFTTQTWQYDQNGQAIPGPITITVGTASVRTAPQTERSTAIPNSARNSAVTGNTSVAIGDVNAFGNAVAINVIPRFEPLLVFQPKFDWTCFCARKYSWSGFVPLHRFGNQLDLSFKVVEVNHCPAR